MPTLRQNENPAKKGSCRGSSYCWVEMDDVNPGVLRRLNAVLSAGSFVVYLGNGLHAYVCLDHWYDAKTIEDLNQALSTYLGADSKWAENTFLKAARHPQPQGEGKGPPVIPGQI